MTTAFKYRKGASVGAQKEKKLWAIFMFLLVTNLPAALYTSLVHQVYPCSLDVCAVLLVIPYVQLVFLTPQYTKFYLLLKWYTERKRRSDGVFG